MNITKALKRGSIAEHRSGKATVLAFEDMGFSLLTVNDVTFVIQDLEDITAINGVLHDQEQVQTFAENLIRGTGVSFEYGWRPRSRPRRARGQIAGVMGLCLACVYLVRRLLR